MTPHRFAVTLTTCQTPIAWTGSPGFTLGRDDRIQPAPDGGLGRTCRRHPDARRGTDDVGQHDHALPSRHHRGVPGPAPNLFGVVAVAPGSPASWAWRRRSSMRSRSMDGSAMRASREPQGPSRHAPAGPWQPPRGMADRGGGPPVRWRWGDRDDHRLDQYGIARDGGPMVDPGARAGPDRHRPHGLAHAADAWCPVPRPGRRRGRDRAGRHRDVLRRPRPRSPPHARRVRRRLRADPIR